MVESQIKEERLAGNGSVVGREGGQSHLPSGGRTQHKLIHPLTQWLQKHSNHRHTGSYMYAVASIAGADWHCSNMTMAMVFSIE